MKGNKLQRTFVIFRFVDNVNSLSNKRGSFEGVFKNRDLFSSLHSTIIFYLNPCIVVSRFLFVQFEIVSVFSCLELFRDATMRVVGHL